jgi:hypothetical protein
VDPFSYAAIFAIGWVMSHAFSEKRDEYGASQEAHREKYLTKLDKHHPSWGRARRERYLNNAARRNALGHFAYLLRHGWSSTFNDFAHGWKNAKTAHEEWKAEHPKDRPSRWQTLKNGWNDNGQRRREAAEAAAAEREAKADDTPPEPTIPAGRDVTAEVEAGVTREHDERLLAAKEGAYRQMLEAFPKVRDDLTEEELAEHMRNRKKLEGDIKQLRSKLGLPPVNSWLDEDEARDARIYPWPTTQTPGDSTGSTNGAHVTTLTISAGEATNLDDVRRNAASFVETLRQVNSAADQLLADTMRFASKDVETRAHIERGLEGLLNVLAEFRAIPTSLQKHQPGEEYAQTSHAVDDINALRPS